MATSNETEQERQAPRYATYAKPMSNGLRLTLLIVGDIMVFLIFAILGRRSHGEATGLSAFINVLGTAAPFAIGWFIVAPFLGLFKREISSQPKRMAWKTALAWLIGWPIALLIRSLYLRYAPPVSFALISLITNMVFLLVWRWPFALRNSLRKE